MKIYDGIYSWDGKRHDSRDPIAWFPGSYRLQIFEVGRTGKNVTALKPYLCIYAETGHGYSISANPEKFAKHICVDFSLDLERVLWVEQLQGGAGPYEVVQFSRSSRLGESRFYQIQKRPPTPPELAFIEMEVAALDPCGAL